MTAKESSIEDKLSEITECCICAEVYDDPRVLPCIHSFCLKCIQLTGKQKQPGEEMPCPVCRTEFIIPMTGFIGLKKNFFMSKLVEMALLQKPSIRETLCDVCRENADEEPVCDIATATMYCTDCRDYLCDRCFRDHKRHKLSRDHHVSALGSGATHEEDIRRFRPGKCEQHVKEQLKLYCLPCQTVLCIMCYVEGHGTHQCSDIEKVAEDFRKDIEKNLDEIDIFLNECLTEKQEFERCRTEVAKEIEQTQSAIILRGQILKELVDKQTGLLLEELDLIKKGKLKETEVKMEELERQRTILDSFKMYCMEMKTKGSSGDICRVFKELHDRTGVLRQVVTTTKNAQSRQKRLHIFFEPTNLEGFSKTYNVVGTLKEETSQEVNPILFKTVITGLSEDTTAVQGFALLDKHIFIVHSVSSKIEVYDSTSFIFQCRRSLKELYDPIDIASCNHNKCLYILDAKLHFESMEIMRVDSMGKLINKWSPGEDWGVCLSITEDSNILLPAFKKNRLNEYSPDGQMIRKIKLSSSSGYPCHAIKLADDKFVVSYTFATSEDDSEEDSEVSDNEQRKLEDEDDDKEKTIEEEENEDDKDVEKDEEEGEKVEENEDEEDVEKDEEEEEDHCDKEHKEEREEENETPNTESEEDDEEEEDKGKIGSDTDEETDDKSNESTDHEHEESNTKKKKNKDRVCIVDSNGNVVKSFGDAGQLKGPICLTIDREGQIIVADRGKSRVLLLSPDLEFRRELISRKHGFRHLRKVQLDESTGRLFVATNTWKTSKRIGGSAVFFRLK